MTDEDRLTDHNKIMKLYDEYFNITAAAFADKAEREKHLVMSQENTEEEA